MNDEDSDLDLKAAQQKILDQGAAVIRRAATDLGFSAAQLTSIVHSAVVRPTPDCLRVSDLEDMEALSAESKAHVEACSFCTSVVEAMNEPPLPARRAEFLEDVIEAQVADLCDQKWLVIDDDAEFREILRDVFEKAGAQVETAASVQEAALKAEALQPDGIVEDLSFEEWGGLLSRIGQVVERPFTSINFCVNDEQRDQSRRFGYSACLEKPFSPSRLIETASLLRKQLTETIAAKRGR